MMKRKIDIAVALILSLLLVACGDTEKQVVSQMPDSQQSQDDNSLFPTESEEESTNTTSPTSINEDERENKVEDDSESESNATE